YYYVVFFFQAEDGIRDRNVTGVQTCALPICAEPPEAFAGKRVLIREDYEQKTRTYVEDGHSEKITLPISNVLKYKLENGAWICVRPSGTEPKIKFYFGVKEASREESEAVLTALQEDVMKRVSKE